MSLHDIIPDIIIESRRRLKGSAHGKIITCSYLDIFMSPCVFQRFHASNGDLFVNRHCLQNFVHKHQRCVRSTWGQMQLQSPIWRTMTVSTIEFRLKEKTKVVSLWRWRRRTTRWRKKFRRTTRWRKKFKEKRTHLFGFRERRNTVWSRISSFSDLISWGDMEFLFY